MMRKILLKNFLAAFLGTRRRECFENKKLKINARLGSHGERNPLVLNNRSLKRDLDVSFEDLITEGSSWL